MFSVEAVSSEQKVPCEQGEETSRQLGWEILDMKAKGEELKAEVLESESLVKGVEIRTTNYFSFLRTVSVVALKVPCPGKLLHPREVGTAGYPS